VDADPRFTGRDVTIAFLDSGFSYHHELLTPVNRVIRLVDATDDGLDDRYFRAIHPESWHGTMSSVIACGSGSLSGGLFCGIATDANVIGVKVFSRKRRKIAESDIAEGIRWVIEHREDFGIRVMNISVGGDAPKVLSESRVDQLIGKAAEAGILPVIAAGNTPGNPVFPPASAPSALTVGGYDDHCHLDPSVWSLYPTTWGLTGNGDWKPDLLGAAARLAGPLLPETDQAAEAALLFRALRASGQDAVRILRTGGPNLRKKPGRLTARTARKWLESRIEETRYLSRYHKSMEGTSVAAAIVSSVAAQMIQANPLLDPAMLRALLIESCSPLERIDPHQQGAGAMNAFEAVSRAVRTRHPSLTPGISTERGSISILLRAEGAHTVALAGDCNGWSISANPCEEIEDGLWSCRIARPADDAMRYKFVIDGRRWIHDPLNDRTEPDGCGGRNSQFPQTENEVTQPKTS